MPVARVVFETDAGKVTGAFREAATGAEKLGDSADKTKQKLGGIFDNVGNRALATITAVVAAQKAIELMGQAIAAVPAEFDRVISKAAGLADLSAKTSITTESLQKLKYAGGLVGVTLEDISAAALKVQANLVKNPELFDKWGLSAKNLRELKPEEQLAAISEAIRAIPEPARQVAAAMDLMGKGGAANLALLRQDISGLIVEADQLGVAMGDDLVGKLDNVDDATTRLTATWEALRDKFMGSIVAASGADEVLNNLAITIGLASQNAAAGQSPLAAWFAIVERLAGLDNLKNSIAILALLNEGGPGVKGATKKAIGGVFGGPDQIDFDKILKEAIQLTEDLAKADDAAAKAAERHAEQARKLAEARQAKELKEYTLAIQDEFNRIMKAEGIHRNVTEALKAEAAAARLAALAQDDLADAAADAAAQVAAIVVADVKRQTEEDVKAAQDYLDKLQKQADEYGAVADAAAGLADVLGGPLGTALSGVAGIFGSLAAHTQQAADNFARTGEKAMTTAQKIQAYAGAVLAVAAAFRQGVASGDKFESTLNGVAAGFAAGIQTGNVYVAVIAAVIGGIAGFLGASKAQKQQMAALRDELARVRAEARLVGVALDSTFNIDNAQLMTAEIKEIRRQMELFERGTRRVQEVIEEFGITFEQFSPEFKLKKANEQALELYEKFQILLAITGNLDLVYEKMGKQLIEFFQRSIKFGLEVPEIMRPMLIWLIDHKLLLDENGNAYETLESTGITFTTTMSEKFQSLLDKINELIDAINNWVIPDKTFKIKPVYVDPGPTPTGPPGLYGYNYDGSADNDGNKDNAVAQGFDGWVLPQRGGVRFRAAEAGRPEYVYASPNGPPSGQGGLGALAAEFRASDAAWRQEFAALRQELKADRLAAPALLKGAMALGRA